MCGSVNVKIPHGTAYGSLQNDASVASGNDDHEGRLDDAATERESKKTTFYSKWIRPHLVRVETFFQFEEREAQMGTEIRAGVVTFLTMAYVLMVNANVMHPDGFCEHSHQCIAYEEIVVATAISSGVGTLICGIFGGLPFVLAPGVGLSTYFFYGLIKHQDFSKEEALVTVFIAGINVLGLTALGASDIVQKYMPATIKTATVVGMGLLIAMVGFKSVGIVAADKDTFVTLGDVFGTPSLLTMAGLLLLGVLMYFEMKGSILVTIVSITVISWLFKIDPPPDRVASLPFTSNQFPDFWSGFGKLHLHSIVPILTFTLVAILDISGVTFGLAEMANLLDPKDLSVKGGSVCFISCGVGSLLAGIMGSTPLIVGIESAAGISDGGRTGMVSCVIALLFFASVFFAPLFKGIPPQATAPVLILIGVLMVKNAREIPWDDISEAIPAFITMVVMPYTFSIPNGLFAGMATYFLLWFLTGKWRKCCNIRKPVRLEGWSQEKGCQTPILTAKDATINTNLDDDNLNMGCTDLHGQQSLA